MIKHLTAQILRSHKLPTTNISREEKQAFKRLRSNREITILPADKGNATVIMNTKDYEDKMAKILNDECYKETNTDPTIYLERKTKKLIERSSISMEIKKDLLPREKSFRIPKLYGLPKIHKTDNPLRPIVSAVNSPTHNVARYLAKQLQPEVETTQSYV
ncbi:hypothetical protein HHI36_008499 [Cryptolaemus montrouzieri]|uniref:Uncharacterized protein n=1 Tax=Cryptolaemus montrouzieri TaxID=559131 RepID=A0ABD2MSQ2_9CUCU